MKHQLLLVLSVGIIFFFVLLKADLPIGNNITGAALVEEETETTYAIAMRHIVNKFFGIQGVQFPNGSCAEIARDLYARVVSHSLDETSGFTTDGPNKLATISFDIEQLDIFGTVDMVKGPLIMNKDGADSLITMSAEAIIRVPKEIKTTYFFLDLYGTTEETFQVTRGSFSTPSVDCSFITRDGQAICDCDVHRVSGVRTGGITALRPVVNGNTNG